MTPSEKPAAALLADAGMLGEFTVERTEGGATPGWAMLVGVYRQNHRAAQALVMERYGIAAHEVTRCAELVLGEKSRAREVEWASS